MRKKLFRAVSGVLIASILMGEAGRCVYATDNSDAVMPNDRDEEYDDQDYEDGDSYSNEDSLGEETIEDSILLDESGITDVTLGVEAEIVSEIVEDREEYSKSYLMSDNSVCMAMYSEPVHYEAENGSFIEIDNSVISTDEGYENADNTYTVLFTDNGESQGEVKFSEDDYEINFEYVDKDARTDTEDFLAESKKAISDGADKEISLDDWDVSDDEIDYNRLDVTIEDSVDQIEENEIHEIRSSTVTYDGYNDGVSLEYEPTSRGIKENIILKDGSCGNRFTFRLNLLGLKARLSSANEVELYDEQTGRTAYYIPAPFMKDSDDNYSDEVWYSIDNKLPAATSEEKAEVEADSADSDDKEDVDKEPADKNLDEPDNEETLESDDSGITIVTDNDISCKETASSDDEEIIDVSDEEIVDVNNEVDENLTDLDFVYDGDDASPDNPATNSEAVQISDLIKDSSDIDSDYIYLTITADEDFLSNASYPVVIDPIIEKPKNDYYIKSCGISSQNFESQLFYVNDELKVGKNNTAVLRSLIRFELPYIEKGSMVTKAELYLNGTANKKNTHYIVAKKVTSNWSFLESGNSYSKDELPSDDGRIIDYAVNGIL